MKLTVANTLLIIYKYILKGLVTLLATMAPPACCHYAPLLNTAGQIYIYISLPSPVLGINRIGQELLCSVPG